MKDDLTKKLILGIGIGIGIPVFISSVAGWVRDVNDAVRYYREKKWSLK